MSINPKPLYTSNYYQRMIDVNERIIKQCDKVLISIYKRLL